jgi:hypothetical protein
MLERIESILEEAAREKLQEVKRRTGLIEGTSDYGNQAAKKIELATGKQDV